VRNNSLTVFGQVVVLKPICLSHLKIMKNRDVIINAGLNNRVGKE